VVVNAPPVTVRVVAALPIVADVGERPVTAGI